jgi:hypothetical protein
VGTEDALAAMQGHQPKICTTLMLDKGVSAASSTSSHHAVAAEAASDHHHSSGGLDELSIVD